MINNYSNKLIDIYEKGLALSDTYSPYMMWKLAKHKDGGVRSYLAKSLVNDTKSSVALDILCKLSKDKDVLVRVEAVDSLSEYCCEKSYRALKNALYDSDYLVRKYAIFGIAYIGETLCPDTTKEILNELEKQEANLHCKVSLYEGFYLLGKEIYLEKLIDLFYRGDYQIQCSVVNALSEIVDEKNISLIQNFLNTLQLKDYPVSVLSSINHLKKVCLKLREQYE